MKVGLLVPIVLLLFESLVSGQQRWYYTGRFQNEDIIIPFFEGLHYEQSELCEPNQSHLMFFGGIIAKSEVLNATEYDSVGELLRSQLLGLANSSTVTIQKAQNYPLIMSRNYAAYVEILNNRSNDTFDTLQYQAEVGLYDHRTRLFLEKYWRNLQIGELTAVEISITKSVPVAAASSSEASVDESDNFELASIDVSATGEAVLFDAEANSVSPEIVELSAEDLRNVPDTKISLFDADQRNDFVVSKHVHKVAYTSDIMGRASIYAHTWSDDSVNTKVEPTETAKKDLRIMSFNLWHNNPPRWVYHNPKERWERYHRRLSHFADVVVSSDPDIIALQEVRLDSSFLSPHSGHSLPHWQNLRLHKPDAGNQAEHVLSYLAQARARAATSATAADAGVSGKAAAGKMDDDDAFSLPFYQFVFQPAMSLIDSQRLQFRNEEGVMILSKYPIEDYQVILLPRAMNETSDDHQRVILKVKVKLPAAFIHSASATATEGDSSELDGDDTVSVDVMTSHFSLSEVARDRGVRTLVQGLISPTSSISSRTSESEGANADAGTPDIATESSVAGAPVSGNRKTYQHSPVQILTGDFNAEPHEPALQYLLDPQNFVSASAMSQTSYSVAIADNSNAPKSAPFVDAWSYMQSQRRLSFEEESEEVLHKREGFTFPACNPVKRIDFIMVRNHSHRLQERTFTAQIIDFRIEGTKPSADTEHLVGSREGLGMNDKDSPLWASDHFAVVADLRIVQSRV